jgi:hypothetical protein
MARVRSAFLSPAERRAARHRAPEKSPRPRAPEKSPKSQAPRKKIRKAPKKKSPIPPSLERYYDETNIRVLKMRKTQGYERTYAGLCIKKKQIIEDMDNLKNRVFGREYIPVCTQRKARDGSIKHYLLPRRKPDRSALAEDD